jgi:hypothetical protein
MQDITPFPDYYEVQLYWAGARTLVVAICSPSIRRPIRDQARNQHPVLAPVQLAVIKTRLLTQTLTRFGVPLSNGSKSCHFRQEDKLCAIKLCWGSRRSVFTCRIYPRYFNQFGAQREHALAGFLPEGRAACAESDAHAVRIPSIDDAGAYFYVTDFR